MSDLDNVLFDLAYQEGKSVSECLYDVYEKGRADGYSQAEKDYFAQSKKDREDTYSCGYAIGRADAIEEFLNKAKKIIRHEVTNAYTYGIAEFNRFAILEDGKTILSEEPFEISADYIINLLEQLKKQTEI